MVGRPAGWVVGKSDFNENPVVSPDLDLDFGLRLRVCQNNKTIKKKSLRPSQVHFDNTVHYSDGSADTLYSHKVVLHHSKQVLYLSNYYVDKSLKEIKCVPLV